MIQPSAKEEARRKEVLTAIKEAVARNETIKVAGPTEESHYNGGLGAYKYEFEGEDDLLHLCITKASGERLTPEEAQEVVAWLLPGLPPGLIWIRPGAYSQHFYCGHDDLVAHVSRE